MAFLRRPMRRSALIGPWGVGAIVPFPNDESLMIAGLDAWQYRDASKFAIEENRLKKRLGVSELRWPPDFREPNEDRANDRLKIPAVRFPTWYYCPFCGQMKKTTYYEVQPYCDAIQWPEGRKCSTKRKTGSRMIPERFIVVCPQGHIDDFPVAEWVHFNSGHTYNPNSCIIRRSTGGASANLTGVYYRCTCGASRSMGGATNKGALKRIQYQCKATKPWLGLSGEEVCTAEPEDLKVVLRGATNVWFADTKSSITIPVDNPDAGKIEAVLRKNFDAVNAQRVNGEINRLLTDFLAEMNNIDPNELYDAFVARANGIDSQNEIDENISEDEYRHQEYRVLCKTSGSPDDDFYSINHPIKEYNPLIHDYFESISLVPKLKETRAFVGFSRLEPTQSSISERKKELRLSRSEDWLPAVVVYGEGLFFQFSSITLQKWAESSSVKDRIAILNQSYHNSSFGREVKENLNPEFVLIHTFAHLIINQLSFDCGYGSSSIRERIYCQKAGKDFEMYGLLIYTASGDAEGSLGGLVRQGEPGRLEDIIMNAVSNASWCASDPVCIQSHGQGPESLNLAACHNCALLPETSCENGNRLLDRGVITGTLKEPELGLFKELVRL